MIHKLILGTAGLGGHEYAGRVVTREDAKCIVNRAMTLGIMSFDTAPAYGDAESILAEVTQGHDVSIHTKARTYEELRNASSRVMCNRVSVLFHNWEMKDGTQPHFDGVSIYQDQLPNALAEGYDLIECEWNLLRQCEMPYDITFIARSVFGRGLAHQSLIAQEIANALDLDVHQLFLQAALQHPKIDHVIIGPQTIEELEQCVAWSRKPLNFWQVLDVADRKLTDPRNYK